MKMISNENLVKHLKSLVADERRIGAEILRYLDQVDRRMVYVT